MLRYVMLNTSKRFGEAFSLSVY